MPRLAQRHLVELLEPRFLLASLIGWWPFDEAAGNIVQDASGNGATGAAPISIWWPGHSGSALSFDGNNYVTIPHRTALNPSPHFTVAAWVKARSWGGAPRILQKGIDDGNASSAYLLYGATNETGSWLNWAFGNTTNAIATAPAPSVDFWHHVAGTYDGSILKLYIDGLLVDSSPWTSGTPDSTGALIIGAKPDLAVGGDFFEGLIDDVRIYDYALAPLQVDVLAHSNLLLNGVTTLSDGRIRLTDAIQQQSGSTFTTIPIDVHAFDTSFDFQITNNGGPLGGGDGFAFVLQNAGPNALGTPGAGLGYSGINHSAAIKFDFYRINQTGLYLSGAMDDSGVDVNSDLDFNSGDIYRVHLNYDGSTLIQTITSVINPLNAFTQSYAVDLPALLGADHAYVGFTGGTGESVARQEIFNWVTADGNAAIVGGRFRLTDALQQQAGNAYTSNVVDIRSFDTSFEFQITNNGGPLGGGDGFTFVLQNAGPNALGGKGAGLGYEGINDSLAVKFDFYRINQTGLYLGGAINDFGVEVPSSLDFNDGRTYRVHLTYDGQTLTETIFSIADPANVFTQRYGIIISQIVGGSHAFAGFTGATGESYSTQEVFNWSFRKPIIGDLNVDGNVSISDFIDLAANFGKSPAIWADGDVNGDGDVTISDFVDLASRFNESLSPSTPGTPPPALAASSSSDEPNLLASSDPSSSIIRPKRHRHGRHFLRHHARPSSLLLPHRY